MAEEVRIDEEISPLVCYFPFRCWSICLTPVRRSKNQVPYFVAVLWRRIKTCCRWFLSLTNLRPAAIHIDPRMDHHCVNDRSSGRGLRQRLFSLVVGYYCVHYHPKRPAKRSSSNPEGAPPIFLGASRPVASSSPPHAGKGHRTQKTQFGNRSY